MHPKKDLAAICGLIERNAFQTISNSFFPDGRLEIIEEIASRLRPSFGFDDRKYHLLRLCAVLTDVYRAEPGIVLSRSGSGEGRIPDRIRNMFGDRFNWREVDMIGRNLSVTMIPAVRVSPMQTVLLLADRFFAFQGTKAYERILDEYLSAVHGTDEIEYVIAPISRSMRILGGHVPEEYFLGLLERFRESVSGLRHRNPTAWDDLLKTLDRTRMSVEAYV